MLHHPYSSRPSANTSPTSPTTNRSSFPNGPKPLAVSNIKRNPEDYPVSPASAAPAYGNYMHSPGLPEPFSPASNNPNSAATTGSATSSFSAPGPNPNLPRVPGVPHDYSRAHSFSSSYAGWQQYPHRVHLPPSETGIKSEQMNPAHRPSASYPGLAGSIPEAAYDRHGSQASSTGHGSATQTNSPLPPGMAYSGNFPPSIVAGLSFLFFSQ